MPFFMGGKIALPTEKFLQNEYSKVVGREIFTAHPPTPHSIHTYVPIPITYLVCTYGLPI